MRRLPVVLLVLMSAVLAGAEPMRGITVHGRARELVGADRFQIDAAISLVRPRLEEAQQGTEQVLERTVQALVKAGLPKPLVNGRQFGRHTRWNGQTQEHTQDGYTSSITLVLILDSKAQLDAALSVLVQSEAVTVSGVSYRAQREIELRKEVRRRALLAAKEKAVEMAGALGAELGAVWTISEAQPMWWGAANNMNSNVGNSMPAPTGEDRPAEGMVEIIAEVDVCFALK